MVEITYYTEVRCEVLTGGLIPAGVTVRISPFTEGVG
jgi:hypothetical protein